MLPEDCFAFFESANQYLLEHPEQALMLEFPDFKDFQCSLCAQCCSVPWQVVVSEAYYHRWQGYLNQHPAGHYTSPFVIHQPDNQQAYAYLRKQPNSHRCVLLNEDNLCVLHQEFGSSAKPEGCQNYPKLSTDLGGYSQGRHTMPSCRSIPLLWESEPELVYQFVTKETLVWSNPPLLRVGPGVRMVPLAFHLWIGLMLDNLRRPGSPLSHLLDLNYVLLHLSQWPSPWLHPSDVQDLQQLFRRYLKQNRKPLVRLHLQKTAWEWVLQFTQSDPQMSPISQYYLERPHADFEPLNPQEKHLWFGFVRNYLMRKCIFYPFWTTGQVDLFQEHYVWSVLILCLELVMLYYREQSPSQTLSLEVLRDAVNLIEARLAQNHVWIRANQIHQMTPAECLEQISVLLAWELPLQEC